MRLFGSATVCSKALCILPAVVCLMLGGPLAAQPRGTASPAASAAAVTPAVLALQVERGSALRDIKTLQYSYAQYGEYGLWGEMADLFSTGGEIIIGQRHIRGRDAIRAYLTAEVGGGHAGVPVGGVNTQLLMAPVITLSADGARARGRWQELTMHGQYGGQASWSGGLQVNDYVRENGVWKIARLVVHPQLTGKYETGWFSATPVIPFLPYHYTSDEAGAPVPPLTPSMTQAANRARAKTSLADVERRIAAMNDEDQVRNLQVVYGYYQDRKMWDDVTDLFASDGVIEIAGLGVYEGVPAIRHALERDGPAGLQRGQVNDQLQLNIVVTVDPNGVEARARGLQLGMLTPRVGEAYWMVATFENRYVKQDGVWRIREMRIYPKMKADYYQGWHRSRVIDPVPTGALAPSRPSPAAESPQTSAVIPAFFDNPATGRPVSYPAGFRVVGGSRLLAAPRVAAPTSTPAGPEPTRIADASRRLARSLAWDAIENISSAWQYAIDDYQWQRYVEVYSRDGWRRKGNGAVYEGRDAIFKAEALSYGPMPMQRDWIRVHTRVQPMIAVSDDAKSAVVRTRMLLYFANTRSPGAFNSGMYHDHAVLEDGVWKWSVGGWIDETYFASRSWALGWAKPNEPAAAAQQGRAAPVAPRDAEVAAERRGLNYPPDIAPDQLGMRGAGVVRGYPNFSGGYPEVKPMWFEYRNPVSGRTPEYFCEDAKGCVPPPVAKARPAAAAPRPGRAAGEGADD